MFTGEGEKQDLTVLGRDGDNFFHEVNEEKLMNSTFARQGSSTQVSPGVPPAFFDTSLSHNNHTS